MTVSAHTACSPMTVSAHNRVSLMPTLALNSSETVALNLHVRCLWNTARKSRSYLTSCLVPLACCSDVEVPKIAFGTCTWRHSYLTGVCVWQYLAMTSRSMLHSRCFRVFFLSCLSLECMQALEIQMQIYDCSCTCNTCTLMHF